MAENMRLYLELMAKSGNLRSELNSSKSAVSRWSSAVKSELSSLRNLAGSITGQLAALGVSFGMVRTMADSARLDKSLTRTKQILGATGQEAALMRKELFTMSRQTGQPLEQLQSGLDTLAAAGLNAKESIEALKAVNVGTAVSWAPPAVLARALTTGASVYGFDLSKPGEALAMLDKMQVAGDLASAELESLSDIFSRIGVNATSAGMSFETTLAYIEALSDIQKQPEKLGTLADSTLRLFTNDQYMKKLEKATRVPFFDDQGARRQPLDILDDLKKKHNTLTTDQQRQRFYSALVGGADLDTQTGFKALMTGDYLAKMREYERAIADGAGTLMRLLPEATNNMVDQVGMLKNDLREAADGFVKPMNETLVSWIKWVRESKGLDGEDMIKYGAGGGLAALLLGRYGGKAAARLFSGPGGLAAGTVTGKAMEEFAGVTPVYVVNMPGSGFGGATGGAAGAAAGAGASLSAGAAGAAAVGATVAVRALYGMGDAAWLTLKGVTGQSLSEEEQDRVRSYGMMPEVALYDLIQGPEVKNEINLNVTIDQDRVTTSSDDPNTKAHVKPMRRGTFADPNYF